MIQSNRALIGRCLSSLDSVCLALMSYLILSLTTLFVERLQASDEHIEQAVPQWTCELSDQIDWIQHTSMGNIIVGTNSALYCLDTVGGSINWTLSLADGIRSGEFGTIPEMHFALAYQGIAGKGRPVHNEFKVIDLVRGSIPWTTAEWDISSCKGYYLLPQLDAVLLIIQTADGTYDAVAADIINGTVLWQVPGFFGECKPTQFRKRGGDETFIGHQPPVFDSDTSMLVCIGYCSLAKYDIRTGQAMWRTSPGIGVSSAPAYNYAPMMLGADLNVAYLPSEKRLHAINLDDGALRWTDPPKLRSKVNQIGVTEYGLLIRGGADAAGLGSKQYLTLLNPLTGEPLWEKEFRKLNTATNFVIISDTAFVFSYNKIYAIDLATGSYREYATKLQFKGDEKPHRLSVYNGQLLLSSKQNVMLIGAEGQVVYHTYNKAPGASLLKKVASFSGSFLVSGMLGALADYSDAATHRYGGVPSSYPRDNFIWVDLGLPTYGSTFMLKEHVVMVADVIVPKQPEKEITQKRSGHTKIPVSSYNKTKPGLIRVSLSTGAVVANRITDDKSPVYTVNGTASKLYLVENKTQVVCYPFVDTIAVQAEEI